jgi:lipopolysaccharide export system permease protein
MSGLLVRLIAKHFLIWVAIVTTAITALAAVGGLVENIKLVNKLGATTDYALLLTGLGLPNTFVDLAAFIFLFAAVMAYIRLNESQALAVMRAAGLSVWQFAAPSLIVTIVLSAILVLIIDPLASKSRTYADQIVAGLKGQEQSLDLLSTGIWVRQSSPNGYYIIHGRSVLDTNTMRLSGVTIYHYNSAGEMTDRSYATEAKIENGIWALTLNAGKVQLIASEDSVDAEEIRERLIDARTVPIWRLPGHIESGRAAGLDMTLHELRLHRLLSTPVFLALMVLIAIVFSTPRGRIVSLAGSIGLAILAGFVANIASQIVAKIAQLAYLPSGIAAWVPSAILLLLTISLLLDREES